MRHALHALALCLSITVLTIDVAHALAPAHHWSQRFGNTGGDIGYSVGTDPSGNVFMTGNFIGTVNFGGADLTTAGATDIFLAKYDAAGVHLWSKRFGDTSSENGFSLATNATGDVFVAGYFNGTINFGGANLVSAGNDDIFVAKFDAAGVHQWSQRFGGTGVDDAFSIAVDASGNVFVGGQFSGTVNFGGANLVSAGLTDIFLAKYNSAGVHQWSQRFGGTSNDSVGWVAAGPSGVVVFTGYFQGTVNFGGSNLTSAGNLEMFVAKFDAAGVHQWSQRFGSTGIDIGYGVAVAPSGSVFLTGQFTGTVNFGGANLVSAGSSDMFLAKYNSAGVHQWSQRFGGASGGDSGYGVAVDASDNVVMAGTFNGTTDFGGGSQTSAGSSDIVLAKYSSTGAYLWNLATGGTTGEAARGIVVDGGGNVLATGNFTGPANFGGAILTTTGAGDNDIFLVKFDPLTGPPAISTIADVGNDQGRQVKIWFTRSGCDAATASLPVTQYECYRRDDAPPAFTASNPLAGAPARERLLASGWVQVGAVAAHGEPTYGIIVPTVGDSTLTLGQYRSTFYVRAATEAPATFFDSKPDSGYSLDNLAPAVPQNFVYNTGQLSWNESTAKDFDFFTVYGSNADSFGAATLVNYSVTSSMNVVASPYVYYYVTATDFSGNEGRPAKINTLSGVGSVPKNYVLSVSNYPNPFNPRTTVTYTAPSPGEVKVRIYDARGAMVKTLFEGHRVAGAYSVDWDGRADNGDAVASGLYFVRIEHASGTRSKKMVLLK